MAHTQVSVSSIAHPGVGCSSQHAPLQLPQKSEAAAHSSVHSTSQHSGRDAHTHSMTAWSWHPGLPFSIQHEPSHTPQSAGQSSQPSPNSHTPSPQHAVPQASPVPSVTHSAVHSSVQHSGAPKVSQTHNSTSWYLHPGVPFASQHSPSHAPH